MRRKIGHTLPCKVLCNVHGAARKCNGADARRRLGEFLSDMFSLFSKCSGSRVWSMHSLTPAGALVGRRSAMALLTGLIRDVARGRGGSVLIEGEPGIGKSALVRAAVAEAPEAGGQVFWGAGDELGQELPLLPCLDALRVREPTANPRRNTMVRLLRGEVSTDRGADVPAVLAEQLLALVAEECAVRPTILVIADLVAALAGGRPDASLLRLADGAAGNPLYVTELVAALARGSRLITTEAGG